ncbi:MAG: hypothetical protein PWP24_1320 [Clostridiales bacterium]|jgi:hypothetical protein|nr:hypothetical protein [Clostridiales bacterium]
MSKTQLNSIRNGKVSVVDSLVIKEQTTGLFFILYFTSSRPFPAPNQIVIFALLLFDYPDI